MSHNCPITSPSSPIPVAFLCWMADGRVSRRKTKVPKLHLESGAPVPDVYQEVVVRHDGEAVDAASSPSPARAPATVGTPCLIFVRACNVLRVVGTCPAMQR